MDPNTHSTDPAGRPDGLATLAAAVDELAAQDLDGLADAARAERVLQLRRLGGPPGRPLAPRTRRRRRPRMAAGADQGIQAPPPPAGSRARRHLGAGAATSAVRTARAVFRGASPESARP
jgi:hypothetical protein